MKSQQQQQQSMSHPVKNIIEGKYGLLINGQSVVVFLPISGCWLLFQQCRELLGVAWNIIFLYAFIYIACVTLNSYEQFSDMNVLTYLVILMFWFALLQADAQQWWQIG